MLITWHFLNSLITTKKKEKQKSHRLIFMEWHCVFKSENFVEFWPCKRNLHLILKTCCYVFSCLPSIYFIMESWGKNISFFHQHSKTKWGQKTARIPWLLFIPLANKGLCSSILYMLISIGLGKNKAQTFSDGFHDWNRQKKVDKIKK